MAAGNAVVATGRNRDAVAEALGEAVDLLVVKLDVTSRADAEAAVRATAGRFGRIDVLVNNAENFYGRVLRGPDAGAGRAAAGSRPLWADERDPRGAAGHAEAALGPHHLDLVTAGLVGFEFGSAYAASKFGLEGWAESLRAEVAPFGIHTTIVDPGFFRTQLLTPESTTYAESPIDDYAKRWAAQLEWWNAQDGQQPGDPAKLAQGARRDCGPGAAAAPLRRRRRCDRTRRAEYRRSPCRHRGLPGPVDLARGRGAPAGWRRAVDRESMRSSYATSEMLASTTFPTPASPR